MARWLDELTATDPHSGFGVSVLKSALAQLAAPALTYKPTIDKSAMTSTAVLTVATPDRQGDIIEPAGVSLAEHELNPIVLFHHGKAGHKLPIGKAEDADGNHTVRLVKANDGREVLVGTTHFSQSNRFAQDVFGLVAEDILRGVSIGFDPMQDESSVNELGPSPTLERPALHFKTCNLLEYSHTPIGVHRDALTMMVHKAIENPRLMHPVLLKYLQPMATPRKTVVAVTKAFDANQSRGSDGKWVSGGEGGESSYEPDHKSLDKSMGKGEFIEKRVSSLLENAGHQGLPIPKLVKIINGKGTVYGNVTPHEIAAVLQSLEVDHNGDSVRLSKHGPQVQKAANSTGKPLVTKAMDEDEDDTGADAGDDTDTDAMDDVDAETGDDAGYQPNTDDPGDDPALADANSPYAQTGDDMDAAPPPTVQAMYDGAQGLLDLCSAVEAAMKKSEHMKGRKYAMKLCADLRSTAAEAKKFGDKVKAELSGKPPMDGDEAPSDEDDNDQEAPTDDEETAEPEMDEEGALVTKGYTPKRWAHADIAAQSTTATTPAHAAPASAKRLKALEREVANLKNEKTELTRTLSGLLDDIEAGQRRKRA